MKTPNEKTELCQMFIALMEETLGAEEAQRLEVMIGEDAEVRSYYLQFIRTYADIKKNNCGLFNGVMTDDELVEVGDDFWRSLSEVERTSPSVHLDHSLPILENKADDEPVLSKPHKEAPVSFRFSRYGLAVAAVMIMSLLLSIVYVTIVPAPSSVVGVLEDSIQANWGSNLFAVGDPFYSDSNALKLIDGVAKIRFTYGAEVILEGPTEFVMNSAEQMTVNYGKVYAYIPKGASGFVVETPQSKIIDVGTEFGVHVSVDGSCSVDMFKGKASMIPGRKGNRGDGMWLVGGDARHINRGGLVNDACLNSQGYVRKMDSEKQLAWRGEAIDLADILGQGNGFGTGTLNHGIDVFDGYVSRELRSLVPVAGVNRYTPVPTLPYVDGVFAYRNDDEPVVVDSDEHVFEIGYKTDGSYWGNIINGAYHTPYGNPFNWHHLKLDGQTYGTEGYPAITIHSNLGVTFDLEAMRNQLPGISISEFVSKIGISETVLEYGKNHYNTADFWVIVDGEERHSEWKSSYESSNEIRVPLDNDDRFLTLIVTDGGDGNGFDWAIFAEPKLILKSS